MRKLAFGAALAALALTTAAPAQDYRDRNYDNGRDRGAHDNRGNYDNRGGDYRSRDDYDAARDYHQDKRAQERRLGRQDRVYRGSDGRYYCQRSNGTTGLIVGGIAGGLLGNALAGRHSETLGTLLGAGGGALLGQSIDRGSMRCR